MSVIELYENGTLKYLMQKGLVPFEDIRDLEMFVDVKDLQHHGMKKTQAVREIADKNRINENTVWKALRKVKTY